MLPKILLLSFCFSTVPFVHVVVVAVVDVVADIVIAVVVVAVVDVVADIVIAVVVVVVALVVIDCCW